CLDSSLLYLLARQQTKGEFVKRVSPVIEKYMSYTPLKINFDSTLDEATEVMAKNHIRHLPVTKSGDYLGIISERDIKTALSMAGADARQIKVGDISDNHPFVTGPSAKLSEVAARMASEKIGSVLVLDNKKLVGILTTTDICKALSEICEDQ
ncbi:MAG: CBS domain-containing protein, partial [Pseudobdellovibrionaceae bacterium]